jgi:hypothetical protein
MRWYLAGAFGLIVGAVWNYGVTSFITWRRERIRRNPKQAVRYTSTVKVASVRSTGR